MKLKEYPVSLLQTLELRLTPVTRLGADGASTHSNLVVTLTSIPSRLKAVAITVRSLLRQSVRPSKIILWLNKDLKGRLPRELSCLESDLFHICYVQGTESHRKLVCSLAEYESAILVTCDDDLIYPKDWLERLVSFHESHPNDVVAHECRNIAIDDKGEVLPYAEWKATQPGLSLSTTLAIGYGGVLYPPGSLCPKVIERELYMALAPKADDLWFKAMSYLQGTRVRRTDCSKPKPVPIIRSQKQALGKTNIKKDKNREQFAALVDYFSLKL